MSYKTVAVATLAIFAIGGQALAADASLASVKGAVMVEQANGSVIASDNQSLSAGSRIVAGKDASAQVKYADGCIVTLAPNAMATIGDRSPCAATSLVRSSQPMNIGFGNVTDVTDTVILVAVGVGAVIGIANSIDHHNHSDRPNPASP